MPEDLLSLPELAMNPLAKSYLDFIFNMKNGKVDDLNAEKAAKGLDFESFVDILSIFHSKTDFQIKLKCRIAALNCLARNFLLDFFKMFSNDGISFTEADLKHLIEELCGRISEKDMDLAVKYTFSTFGASPVTEDEFIKVSISYVSILI